MARAIDKKTVLDLIIEAKRADPETGSFAEWLAEYLVEHLPTLTPPNEWVSVEEGMPKEHDSIFKKLMGPDKWGPGMFERLSDDGGWDETERFCTHKRRDLGGSPKHWLPRCHSLDAHARTA